MDIFNSEFAAMSLHKSREQELLAQAENERKAKSLKQKIAFRVRRTIRVNNDPIR